MTVKRFSKLDNSLEIYYAGKKINVPDWQELNEYRGFLGWWYPEGGGITSFQGAPLSFRIKDDAPLDATLYYLAHLRRFHKTPEDWAREVRVLFWAAMFGVDA